MTKGLITALIGAAVYAVGATLLPWQTFELAGVGATSLALHPVGALALALALGALGVSVWGLATGRRVAAARVAALAGLGLVAWMVTAQAARTFGLHLVPLETVAPAAGFVIALLGTFVLVGGAATALLAAPRWDEATPVLRVRAEPLDAGLPVRELVVYEPRALSIGRELGLDGPAAVAVARVASARLVPEGEVVLGLDAGVPVAVSGHPGAARLGARRGDELRIAHGARAVIELDGLALRFDFVRQDRCVPRRLIRPGEAAALALVTALVCLAAGVATILGRDVDVLRVLPDEEHRTATIAALTEEDRRAEDPVTIDTALVEVRDVAKAAGGVEGKFGDPEASPAKPMKVPPRDGRMVDRLDPKKVGLLETLSDSKVQDALAEIIAPDGAFAAKMAAMTNGHDDSWSLSQGTRGLSIKGDGDGGPGDGTGRLLGQGPIDTGPGPGVVVALAPREKRKVPSVGVGAGVVAGNYCKRADIESVVRRRAGAIRACYEQRLQVSDGLKGKLNVRWTIGLDGKVMAADAGSDTLGDTATTQCVLRAVRGMRFPEPDGGICVVNWPFVFNPG